VVLYNGNAGTPSALIGTNITGTASLNINGTVGATTATTGAFTTATASTSVTTPLLIGGTATTSPLTYKTTTGVGTTGADHIFQVGNNGATEAMRILNNGNVGIGTTNPAQKLQIGNGVSSGTQFVRLHHSASDIYIGQSNNSTMGVAGNAAALLVSDGSSFPFAIGTTGSQPLIIGTANTERIRITDVGTVGINTASPAASAILDVTSTTKGLLFPRMTTTQKNAITGPSAGLVVYDTTLNKLCVFTTVWETITSL
jgi:hypothetical protein